MDQLDAWSARGRLATAVTNVRASLTSLAADGEELILAMTEAEALTSGEYSEPTPNPPETPKGISAAHTELSETDLSDTEFALQFIGHLNSRIAVLTGEVAHLSELRARLTEWGRRQEASDADRTA